MKKPVNLINPMLGCTAAVNGNMDGQTQSEQLEMTMQVSSRNEFYPKLSELSIKSGD